MTADAHGAQAGSSLACRKVPSARLLGSLREWFSIFQQICCPSCTPAACKGRRTARSSGGVFSFWQAGAWDIALLIFIASVAIPATKFIALGLMLWTVRQGSVWGRAQRAKLYRVVDFIGYWSMLDVVVVAITSALLQFKAFGTAEPRVGILFFCLVVVTTMLAAKSFDPRLIWDVSPR